MKNIAQTPEPEKLTAPHVAAMQTALKYLDAIVGQKPDLTPFDALHAALDEAERGGRDLWTCAHSDRSNVVDAFNTWVIEQHTELKKKMASSERLCRELSPLSSATSWTRREFESTAAEYVAMRSRFKVFDDYYLAAVYDETEGYLDMRLPCVQVLWAWYQLEKAQA